MSAIAAIQLNRADSSSNTSTAASNGDSDSTTSKAGATSPSKQRLHGSGSSSKLVDSDGTPSAVAQKDTASDFFLTPKERTARALAQHYAKLKETAQRYRQDERQIFQGKAEHPFFRAVHARQLEKRYCATSSVTTAAMVPTAPIEYPSLNHTRAFTEKEEAFYECLLAASNYQLPTGPARPPASPHRFCSISATVPQLLSELSEPHLMARDFTADGLDVKNAAVSTLPTSGCTAQTVERVRHAVSLLLERHPEQRAELHRACTNLQHMMSLEALLPEPIADDVGESDCCSVGDDAIGLLALDDSLWTKYVQLCLGSRMLSAVARALQTLKTGDALLLMYVSCPILGVPAFAG